MLHLLGRLTPELYDRDPTLRSFVATAGDGPDGLAALRGFLAGPRQAPDRPRQARSTRRAPWAAARVPAPAARVAGYWREHGTRRTTAAVARRLARAARLSRSA